MFQWNLLITFSLKMLMITIVFHEEKDRKIQTVYWVFMELTMCFPKHGTLHFRFEVRLMHDYKHDKHQCFFGNACKRTNKKKKSQKFVWFSKFVHQNE